MKKLFLILSLIFFCCPTFVSCGDSNDEPELPTTPNQNEEPKEEVRYYVKYDVCMQQGVSGQITSIDITYLTEKGKQTIITSEDSWTGTYGPFKKGDKLYLQALGSGPLLKKGACYVRISVCREKEPFVIKGEQCEHTTKLDTEYTIDF